MNGPLPPVPGVHFRTCPTCGTATTVTDETSRRVAVNAEVETREYDCPGCAGTVRYKVPSWEQRHTTRDVNRIGEWLSRRSHLKREKERHREQASERNGDTNG
jgi:predicted RNA-binding Zn-ribbon protein involved in translation (DUF1610 family)